MSAPIYVGLDIGSSRTKVAAIDADRQVLGHAVRKSGTDFSATASACLDESLEMAGYRRDEIVNAVSTGYGRANVAFVTTESKTEIGCLSRWGRDRFHEAITIIDIGGQDNKVIKLDEAGRRASFKMNRKCAAGTGAFLEEMSLRLDIPLEAMDALARQSLEMVKLGSYCTVFSATEVLENIRHGKKVPDIVKGLFYSVVKRVLEMDSHAGRVVMTGGVVAHNPYIVEMAGEMVGQPVVLPETASWFSACLMRCSSCQRSASDSPASTRSSSAFAASSCARARSSSIPWTFTASSTSASARSSSTLKKPGPVANSTISLLPRWMRVEPAFSVATSGACLARTPISPAAPGTTIISASPSNAAPSGVTRETSNLGWTSAIV